MYRDISDIVYLLDVLVVVVYISHCNCWIIYYCMRIEVSVLRAGRGRRNFFLFAQKFSWGLKTPKKNWGGILGCLVRPTPPPGGHAGSENDTLLHMTRDRTKFWNGPAWRSKVIIRKPWRRKNKKNSDKTIRHSRRGMLISCCLP